MVSDCQRVICSVFTTPAPWGYETDHDDDDDDDDDGL